MFSRDVLYIQEKQCNQQMGLQFFQYYAMQYFWRKKVGYKIKGLIKMIMTKNKYPDLAVYHGPFIKS